ncbi:MAG TPA: acyltransferase [Terrimicrobiaceae bacterium]
MKSSSGSYFIAVDHIRALAAFTVFTWHFTHAEDGYPVAFEYVPAVFPLALLDEGHTGVALFMTLSGYLFAKLLDGKSIHYGAFLFNRALRLLPLLVLVILAVGFKRVVISGMNISTYVETIAKGVVFPILPNGGWSIAVEGHYYLILPLFLWMLKKSKLLPLALVFAAIALRCFLYQQRGEIQSLAYWTIVGRIDQFTLGMLVFQFRAFFAKRHAMAIATITAFMAIYWLFDFRGGFAQMPSYPSPSSFWIILPTIEAIAYAVGIAWYDNSFSIPNTGVSKFIARIGQYSYSIYLLHFFVAFYAARFVDERIMDISNFYLACLWSMVFFLLMMLPGYVSFRFIEAPFLKLRRRYIAVRPGSQETYYPAAQRAAQGEPPASTTT